MTIPSIGPLRSRLDQAIGRRDSVVRNLGEVTTEIQSLDAETALLDQVQALFQQLIDREVTSGVEAVEALQTEGLRAVFDDQDLQVRSSVDIQRGKVSVDLVTVEKHADGHEVEGLGGDAFGGAVTTVESVLLRVIILMRRGLRPLLLLDESLPAFDPNYVLNMGRFLSALCKRVKMDVLLVTHNQALVEAADNAYRLVPQRGSVKLESAR